MEQEKLVGRDAHIARLRSGERTSFRETGNSMMPKIRSRQRCTYAPIAGPEELKKGDIVFCNVGRYHFTHLISAIKGDGKDRLYQISNNKGHVNGWIPLEKIFGKVVEIHPD